MLKKILGDEQLKVPLASPAGICVSIACDNVTEAVDIAKQSEADTDIIEIRLDTLSNAGIDPFVNGLSKPLLFTNRPTWEGGSFSGSEVERVAWLLKAIESGCAFVDLELKTSPELRAELLDVLLEHPHTGLVISWHDFSGTPSSDELGDILQQQIESGAHVGKIVTMAKTAADVLRVLSLQLLAVEKGFPLIAFCMGRAGMISRLATVELGGYMTYAAPDSGQATAPGQLKVSALRSMLKTLVSEA